MCYHLALRIPDFSILVEKTTCFGGFCSLKGSEQAGFLHRDLFLSWRTIADCKSSLLPADPIDMGESSSFSMS
uniref:Uncharacterized protein n=1 Tax=Arundo donax TaxID=35708 RepID=A0A0A9ENP5_ARUDO